MGSYSSEFPTRSFLYAAFCTIQNGVIMSVLSKEDAELFTEAFNTMGDLSQNGKFRFSSVWRAVMSAVLEIHMAEFMEQGNIALLKYEETRSYRYDKQLRYCKNAESALKLILSRIWLGYDYNTLVELVMTNLNHNMEGTDDATILPNVNTNETSE